MAEPRRRRRRKQQIDRGAAIRQHERGIDGRIFADGNLGRFDHESGQDQELKVISRSSAATYRNAPRRDLREIGRQLGVSNVLEGRLRHTVDRVLLNVSLVDTGNGHQV